MTNNAQLLPLPEGSLICWTPNPEGPCDIVYTPEQMRSYALACIEAAQPADEGWKTKAAFGMYSHDGKIIDAAKPADALGSLPVVAYEVQPRYEDCDGYFDYMKNDGSAHKLVEKGWKVLPLTDHAQATAEIAKRDAEIESIRFLSDFNIGRIQVMEEELTTLRAKLAGVDGLVEEIGEAIGDIAGIAQYTAQEFIRAALATYEAAQGEKE